MRRGSRCQSQSAMSPGLAQHLDTDTDMVLNVEIDTDMDTDIQ